MSSYQQTDYQRSDVLGEIDPERLYDTGRVMAICGIGENRLIEERRAGRIVAVKDRSGRQWYRGEDLIGLIWEHGTKLAK